MDEIFKEEAESFSQRIEERLSEGFVPDLREMVPCDYFYKSFWRHPHYANLYVGEMFRNYQAYFSKYLGKHARILDLGCGAGYFSLELARNGYHVVGIDIAESCIATANEVSKNNKHKQTFGSLSYSVGSYRDIRDLGVFDAVLCSGVLHHLPDVDDATDVISAVLRDNGLLVWHEPQHEEWMQSDAAMVSVIRLMLQKLGFWYEDLDGVNTSADLLRYVDDVKTEYVLERDAQEAGGQSPHDHSSNKEQILSAIQCQFDVIETKPSFSYIYRMLGGMRGDQEKLNEVASLLTLIDRTFVDQGLLKANYFYGVARKK